MQKIILLIFGTSLYFFMSANSVYATTYEYDDLGRVTQVTYENGDSVTYDYDANGNIVEIQTGNEPESQPSDDDKDGEIPIQSSNNIQGDLIENQSLDKKKEGQQAETDIMQTEQADKGNKGEELISENDTSNALGQEEYTGQDRTDDETDKLSDGAKRKTSSATTAMAVIATVLGVGGMACALPAKKKGKKEGSKE